MSTAAAKTRVYKRRQFKTDRPLKFTGNFVKSSPDTDQMENSTSNMENVFAGTLQKFILKNKEDLSEMFHAWATQHEEKNNFTMRKIASDARDKFEYFNLCLEYLNSQISSACEQISCLEKARGVDEKRTDILESKINVLEVCRQCLKVKNAETQVEKSDVQTKPITVSFSRLLHNNENILRNVAAFGNTENQRESCLPHSKNVRNIRNFTIYRNTENIKDNVLSQSKNPESIRENLQPQFQNVKNIQDNVQTQSKSAENIREDIQPSINNVNIQTNNQTQPTNTEKADPFVKVDSACDSALKRLETLQNYCHSLCGTAAQAKSPPPGSHVEGDASTAGGEETEDMRRKRAELSVALRKQARDDQLLKRRALSPDHADQADRQLAPEEIVQGLQAQDVVTLTASARAARRALSREQNPPITAMVRAGVIKPLVEALDRDDCADLQFEAAWALTNIASGTQEHTAAVVDGGAIPKLVTLLGRGGTVAEQSAWALGNIAGDGARTRDLVLAAGALPALLPLMAASAAPGQLRTAVWTYSNLCRNKNPLVQFDLVSPALPHVAELLDISDQDVLADACWALSYLTDGPNERIEAVQTSGPLLPRLCGLLAHRAASVRTPALRALGNMLTGTDQQTDRCLAAGCLPHIIALLQCGKPSLVKEAAWAMSNILAGTAPQIQRAVDDGALPPLLHVLAHDDIKCQKEAAWAITNMCLGGSPAQLDALLAAGFLEPYCALLAAADCRAVCVVLDGLANLLQAASKFGQTEALCMKLEEMGALDQIEQLQHHENEQIYSKTLHILDTYFSETEESTQPAQTDNEYQFGTSDQRNINF